MGLILISRHKGATFIFRSISVFRVRTMLPRRLISTAAPKPIRYPYFVPRNSRGNLPVYTDVRNGGTRYLVLVRNVDGEPDVRSISFPSLFSCSHPPRHSHPISLVIFSQKTLQRQPASRSTFNVQTSSSRAVGGRMTWLNSSKRRDFDVYPFL